LRATAPVQCDGVTRVGFIGLGNQGAPMARRIVEHGHELVLWARRPESTAPFADTRATVVSTPADVGAASDVVGICVFTDADVQEVLLGSRGVLAGMAPGGVVAIHSTVLPDTCASLAQHADPRGIAVVDAPVSGGPSAAAEGRLLLMAGGDDAAVATCRPVFETFADPVVHLGALGTAQMAKAINNMLLAVNMAAAMDAFAFADELGVDRRGLAQALIHGTGGSAAAQIVADTGFDAEYLRVNSAPYFMKDLEVLIGMAQARGVPFPEALVAFARRAFVDGARSEGARSEEED
jgi:3-hydroxyisobutyrate dehydrogenase-like beta-hydroxyacid dehydrogenase